MDRSIITLSNISKRYGKNTILENVNISVYKDQCVAVCGNNGCGKSTLLKIISGLSAVSSGERTVPNMDSLIKISYVPEHFPKLPLSPLEYLTYMGKIQGLEESQISTRIKELFDSFCIPAIMQKSWIKNLSKGTIQKVAVIQAILEKPCLLILDEPLSGQDTKSQANFIEVINNFKSQGIAIVLACHENDLVDKLADRVVVLKDKTIQSDERVKTKEFSAICFRKNGKNSRQSLEFLEEVQVYKESDEYLIIQVHSDNINSFIRKIIDSGYDIYSVNTIGKNIDIHPSGEYCVHK